MKNMKKINKILFSVFVAAFMFYIIKEPKSSTDIVLRGLNLCYFVIIPVIFPFLAFSKMFIYSSFFGFLAKIINKPARFLFGISGEYANAFLIGGVAGFPMGAKTVKEVYLSNKESKNEAERTLAFCNNCSVSFVISAAGIAVFGSFKIGLYLFCIQLISSVITGIIIKFIFGRGGFPCPPDKNPESYINNKKSTSYTPAENPAFMCGRAWKPAPTNTSEVNFSETISDSVNGILNVCGTVLFFYIVTNISFEFLLSMPFISELLNPQAHGILSGLIKTAISGILEISSGTYSLTNFYIPLYYKLILSSIILAWSGISVHFQILYTVKEIDLSLKPYFTGKIIHVIISVLTTIFTFGFIRVSDLSEISEVSTAAAPVSIYPAFLNHFDLYTAGLIFTGLVSAAAAFAAAVIMIIYCLFEKNLKNRKNRFNIKI